MEYLNHCREDIELERPVRDGQFDAILYEGVFPRAGVLYMVPHGLGRPVKQYQVVFSDKNIGIPACGRDSVGRFINDADQIGLIFDVDNVTARLRFS
jgi:hypothetical protein